MSSKPDSQSGSTAPARGFRRFRESFTDLFQLPVAFWIVIFAFVVDSAAYYGVLTLMTTYLSEDLHWGDKFAGITVSVFTMTITVLMLGVGSYAERFGLRRAILAALFFAVIGRALYSIAPEIGHFSITVTAILAALLVVGIGEAILQPVCYSGIKQYTNDKTSAMGYGLIYAIMNLGIVGIATVSSWMRPAVQNLKDHKPVAAAGGPILEWFAGFSHTGVQAVNWACTGFTVLTLVGFLVLMTRRVEANKLRPDPAAEQRGAHATLPLRQRLCQFFAGGPFSNPRFIFFIFMLLPVRTLFAHQWLTMPQYIIRAYPPEVGDKMELLINWINPGIIFFGVPLATALTRHVNVYTMMVVGSLVSALPTFLLCGGPNLTMLISYFVVFSIGEALWSARFLEYASELAPPGRVAQYMGLANIPWLLAKGTTGFYSGILLANYVPAHTPPEQQHSGRLFFIYGCIAMLSPIGLWVARKWVRAGLK